ncbi:rho-related GTP-binding protein RhoF [Callorhinchus milii]|uniref:Ras homolog family member F n=1 Tax=Callorhinchus milii TaxID=7868 RepID=V9KWD9_CALMI|nr:rho-related GTP-binding protein RhoF [Callorhinchus milii]|eukprot:gi/632968243/ref/XP_007900420.1/ PREDICTED: rho-related GTP-binding protein RhoF [Callorhinchus milii]
MSERECQPAGRELKIVIVGDGGCGKTSLLLVFAKGDFPEQYAPSVFEKYVKDITVGNKIVTLTLYDTAGQEDYDRLRPLAYQDANVVLICYDVTNPTSYENVLIKWYPEVAHFCPGVPILLIGCKTDLRMDKERLRKLRASELEPVTYSEGDATAKQIKAVMYLECSAKFRENIEDIFKETAKAALKEKRKKRKKQKACQLL